MKNLPKLLLILILCVFTAYSQEPTNKGHIDEHDIKPFTSVLITKSPTKNLQNFFVYKVFDGCAKDNQS